MKNMKNLFLTEQVQLPASSLLTAFNSNIGPSCYGDNYDDDDDDDEKEEEKEEGDVELLTHSVQIFMLVENKPSLMIVVDDHTNLAVDDKYPPPDIVDGKK